MSYDYLEGGRKTNSWLEFLKMNKGSKRSMADLAGEYRQTEAYQARQARLGARPCAKKPMEECRQNEACSWRANGRKGFTNKKGKVVKASQAFCAGKPPKRTGARALTMY